MANLSRTSSRREANWQARLLFERARRIDPGYGRSYAALSRTFNLDWRYAWSADPDASLDRALELAELAIQHDPLDARAHAELGFACLYRKQHGAALVAYERAVELNPNDADILAEMGDALWVRRAKRAGSGNIRLGPWA